MATIRLIPSTYYINNINLSVSDEDNMYANTDNTNYATVTNYNENTNSYYIYIRGFNFDDIPSKAIVKSIRIKLKANCSGGKTNTISCYNGTTEIIEAGYTTALEQFVTVKTFTNTTIDCDTLKTYGSDFGIRIDCRRADERTQSMVYIYGAEILIDFTVKLPIYCKVNSSFVQVSVIYKKVNGSWVKQTDDYEKLFDNSNIYITN